MPRIKLANLFDMRIFNPPLFISLPNPCQSFDRGVASGFGEGLAFAEATLGIELEQLHGGLPNRVYRVDANSS